MICAALSSPSFRQNILQREQNYFLHLQNSRPHENRAMLNPLTAGPNQSENKKFENSKVSFKEKKVQRLDLNKSTSAETFKII